MQQEYWCLEVPLQQTLSRLECAFWLNFGAFVYVSNNLVIIQIYCIVHKSYKRAIDTDLIAIRATKELLTPTW